MPDEPTPPEGGETEPVTGSDRSAPEGEDELDPASEIKPGMSERQIRDAGLAIDVPFESGMAEPQRLKYGDIGDEYAYGEGKSHQAAEKPEPEVESEEK